MPYWLQDTEVLLVHFQAQRSKLVQNPTCIVSFSNGRERVEKKMKKKAKKKQCSVLIGGAPPCYVLHFFWGGGGGGGEGGTL